MTESGSTPERFAVSRRAPRARLAGPMPSLDSAAIPSSSIARRSSSARRVPSSGAIAQSDWSARHDRSSRALLAAPAPFGHLAADERLERAGIGRIELEDPCVGGLRVAHREPPLLERRQLPERAEPGAHVDERVPLARQDARERRPAVRAPRDRLEEAQRAAHARAAPRRWLRAAPWRARKLRARLGEQPREIERRPSARRCGVRRTLESRQDVRRELRRARPVARGGRRRISNAVRRRPSREHPRQPLRDELVVRRLRERLARTPRRPRRRPTGASRRARRRARGNGRAPRRCAPFRRDRRRRLGSARSFPVADSTRAISTSGTGCEGSIARAALSDSIAS